MVLGSSDPVPSGGTTGNAELTNNHFCLYGGYDDLCTQHNAWQRFLSSGLSKRTASITFPMDKECPRNSIDSGDGGREREREGERTLIAVSIMANIEVNLYRGSPWLYLWCNWLGFPGESQEIRPISREMEDAERRSRILLDRRLCLLLLNNNCISVIWEKRRENGWRRLPENFWWLSAEKLIFGDGKFNVKQNLLNFNVHRYAPDSKCRVTCQFSLKLYCRISLEM